MYEQDLSLQAAFRQVPKLKVTISRNLQGMRSTMSTIKQQMAQETRLLNRGLKRVGLILTEYRERCRDNFIDYLKVLDLDLRKILKPLVPSDVLEENIKYQRLNESTSTPGSLNSTVHRQALEGEQPSENDDTLSPRDASIKQMSEHIQLLVNTLENLARELITVCTEVDRKYYEIVDIDALKSDAPTPLAAPLPEYFSFEASDLVSDRFGSELHSQREVPNAADNRAAAAQLKRRLEKLAAERSGMNLEKLLEPGSVMPISERERMVFSIINCDTPAQKHVTLNEILGEDYESYSELQSKSFDVAPRAIIQRRTPEQPISIGTKHLRSDSSRRRSSHNLLEKRRRSHAVLMRPSPTRSKAQETLLKKSKQAKRMRIR